MIIIQCVNCYSKASTGGLWEFTEGVPGIDWEVHNNQGWFLEEDNKQLCLSKTSKVSQNEGGGGD